MLHIAASNCDEIKHFAIIKSTMINPPDKVNSKSNSIKAFDAIDKEIKEAAFKELGIQIIWIDNFSEIPTILNKIREK